MAKIIFLLQHYGVLIVFATVLIEQIGLPVPAYPVLIVAGALVVGGDLNWPACLAAGMSACLISDLFWFNAGRRYGKRILRLLCMISLSPDYCVSQTEDNFRRYGPKALIVSKFVPGFNTIAAPLSGALGTSLARFLSFSVLGSLIWGGSGLVAGAFFHDGVDQVLDVLSTMGGTALLVLSGLLAAFVLFKYIERRRFQQGMQVERILIDELMELIHGGHAPVLVDARSITAQQLEPAIPGALVYNAFEPAAFAAMLDKDRHVVVYCSCPNDVTAAKVAKELHAQGFRRVRPLQGGLDAWNTYERLPEAAAAVN